MINFLRTAWKIEMEPENTPLEKGKNHLPKHRFQVLHSLKLTYRLKIHGWKTPFLLGAFRPIFRGENVGFREGILIFWDVLIWEAQHSTQPTPGSKSYPTHACAAHMPKPGSCFLFPFWERPRRLEMPAKKWNIRLMLQKSGDHQLRLVISSHYLPSWSINSYEIHI